MYKYILRSLSLMYVFTKLERMDIYRVSHIKLDHVNGSNTICGKNQKIYEE